MKNENKKAKRVNKTVLECAGIHELLDWQIIQYRREVDLHRIDLSKAEGRCIPWQDAEHDYNVSDRAVLGEKSRVEYCGMICPERENCLVALQFLRSRHVECIPKFG